jgi:hypothetical protein
MFNCTGTVVLPVIKSRPEQYFFSTGKSWRHFSVPVYWYYRLPVLRYTAGRNCDTARQSALSNRTTNNQQQQKDFIRSVGTSTTGSSLGQVPAVSIIFVYVYIRRLVQKSLVVVTNFNTYHCYNNHRRFGENLIFYRIKLVQTI